MRPTGRRGLRAVSRPIHPLLGSIMSVRTDRPIAALTFDDGPDEKNTIPILEVLAGHAASATFFLLAGRAAQLPKIVAAIRAGGHEIALHGYDHSPLVDCSTREKARRIHSGKRALQSLMDEPVRFFRPPYGWQDVRGFLTARLLGFHVVGWSAEGHDWLDITPGEVADRAAASLRQGGIVLLHDRCEPSPARPHIRIGENLDRASAVDELLQRAASQRIQFVSVGTLLTHGTPLRHPWFQRPDESDILPRAQEH